VTKQVSVIDYWLLHQHDDGDDVLKGKLERTQTCADLFVLEFSVCSFAKFRCSRKAVMMTNQVMTSSIYSAKMGGRNRNFRCSLRLRQKGEGWCGVVVELTQ